MSVQNTYTSIACNRAPETADWGENDLILFAACNSIAVFDPNYNSGAAKITQLFVEHSAKVNTVKWISKHEFLSGGYDKVCILWNVENFESPKIWKLIGHESGVTFLDAINVNGHWTIVTTSLDSTIRFWHLTEDSNQYETFDTINLGNGFCFALKFCILPDTTDQIMLAYSTDENHIYLCCDGVDENGKRKFTKVDVLVGHVDWVRGLDFVALNDSELLLASSAQDTFIRLWKISARPTIKRTELKSIKLFAANDEIQIEERIFTVTTKSRSVHSYAVALESILLGHDSWVYSVHWSKSKGNQLQLLSSSIDKTLIIWSMHEDNGVWLEKVRVGEVGGNSLGFYGGKFSPDCSSILGHGYHGSFHLWHCDENTEQWTPGVVVGGHFAEVRDLCWEQKGEFLLTVSADQTTRCHTPWKRTSIPDSDVTWHELARPQVHGYDMQTICALSRYRFASGAEEKIVRIFQAPANFVQNFQRICNVNDDPEGDAILKTAPKGASVPSLGLSNKAVYEESNDDIPSQDRHIKDQYPDNYFVPTTMTVPPTEETLMQNTLWPEIQKLYGHGYEVFALCATSDGKILASSCRATNEEHAQIILWNTSTWKQIQKLASHQLTVTEMKFSPNNTLLLSVSRDRRWSLFENQLSAKAESLCDFKLIAISDKKNGIHTRIIWTCNWSHDTKYFGTGSRDGKIVAWQRTEVDSKTSLGYYAAVDTFEFGKNDSVTAIAFGSNFLIKDQSYFVAVGLENGFIHLLGISDKWNKLLTINQTFAHHLTVKKLAFRPSTKNSHQLASCGLDNLVRIYDINV